ncbi:hypothetical protein A2U01_0058812, partial [Trifolium medium]|nr:hypothetical protein [Trifolium medium]
NLEARGINEAQWKEENEIGFGIGEWRETGRVSARVKGGATWSRIGDPS